MYLNNRPKKRNPTTLEEFQQRTKDTKPSVDNMRKALEIIRRNKKKREEKLQAKQPIRLSINELKAMVTEHGGCVEKMHSDHSREHYNNLLSWLGFRGIFKAHNLKYSTKELEDLYAKHVKKQLPQEDTSTMTLEQEREYRTKLHLRIKAAVQYNKSKKVYLSRFPLEKLEKMYTKLSTKNKPNVVKDKSHMTPEELALYRKRLYNNIVQMKRRKQFNEYRKRKRDEKKLDKQNKIS